MKKRLLTLMSGMLIAAAASVNLYAEDTSPQQAPRSDVEESSTLITGEHPRGTWKIYKEATADKPRGLLEVYINQGKHSLCDYDQWETFEGNSVDRRYATTAPWGSYFEYIKGVEVYSDAGNTITDLGSSAFAGLDMDTILQPGNNGVNAFNSINYINARAFLQARLPKSVSFPNVTRVGEAAFMHTNIKTIDLLNVRTLEEDAFKSEDRTLSLRRQQSYVEYIDLGAGIQTIKAGALAAESLWKYDETPSVFISNPTPPEWSRLYEESTSEAFWNAIGLGLGHEYEYPFGDKPGTKRYYSAEGYASMANYSDEACEVIVVVPPEYLQTYIDFYPSHHPEVSEGYMCAYYADGDHNGSSLGKRSCGRLVAGKTIYSNSGEFIGWWYFDSEKNYLHIGTTDPSYTLPAYTASNAPWRAFLGQASRVILHMNKIADNAFSNGALNGVTYVEIAAKECEIGKNAFSGHSTLKYVERYYNREAKLSIGEKAFFNCPNLEYVSMYFTATSLGKSAFESCPKLNVAPTIKVKDIPENAFRGCSNLNSKYIDFSWVNTIGAQAFEGCSYPSFKEIKFSKDLTSIGTKAFKDCSRLYDIYVESANVPTTASDAFSGVTLSNITLHANGSTYADYGKHAIWGQMKVDKNKVLPVGGPGEGWSISSDGTLVVYKMTGNYSSCTEQPWYSYREFINNIIIDNGVTFISENEFSFPKAGESHVTSVSIPRSCKSIRANAFRNNDQLKTIYISSVENLGDRAFYGCSELEVIELGENLMQAGNYVFQGCVKLEKVYDYTLQAATVGDDFLTGIRTALTSVPARAPQQQQVNPNMPTLYVQDAALCNYLVANGWKDFNFGNTTEHGTIVDNGVFGNGHYILWSDGTLVCSSSEGSNVTLSGAQRTLWKNSVKRIEVIGDLTELSGVFQNLSNLEFVSLSGNVKKLNSTFTNCTKLESIVLDNVESVGFKCFSGCTGLTKAIMPRLKEIGQNAFENTSSLEVAKTGEGCVINYQAFKNSAIQMIDLSSADLTNATGAFDNCTNLKYVAYNGTVLPQKIFMGCTALQKVDLGSNLETVLSRAFEGCTALDTIYIQCPTAPAVPTETWKENNVDVDYHGFSGLALQPIRLIVPDVYWRTYLSAPVWEDMNLTMDTRPVYADMSYPIYIPLGGGKGMAIIYDYNDGKPMTIDYEGPLPAEAHKLIDRYMPLNERAIVISDNVTEIPAASSTTNMTTHVTASEYLQIGANVKSIGGYAFYNNYWNGDNFYIDCYAPVPPTLVGTSFNMDLMNEKVGDYGIKEREKVNLYIIDDDAVYDRYIHAPYYHYFNIIRNLAPSGAPQLVTVTFLDWDDRMIAQETVEWGGHVAFPADPVRQGYVFKGWSENSLSNIQADMTVRAEYYENMYTVRFFDWDNTLIKEEQVLHGHSATAPEDPIREGYMFTGWGAGWFDVTSDLDLYASYIKEGSEDIEDVQADVISTKFIHNGQMYIRRGNAIYTIQGQRVK